MYLPRFFAILSMIFAAMALVAVPGHAATDQVALVIGNGGYASSPLANPVNDANDMAAALEELGFSVIQGTDLDRRQMRRMIRRYGEAMVQAEIGLFYYAGHGLQVAGENFLVPVGAEILYEDEIPDECLKVSAVLRKMETAGNRMNIIILDACRDNPFKRSFRSSNKGLAKMDAPHGSLLAYATAPGSTAADGKGRNGLYTARLLETIREPGLPIEKVFKKVRVAVMAASGNRQVPWESSSLTGDFYFKKKPLNKAPLSVSGDAKTEGHGQDGAAAIRQRLEAEMKILREQKALAEMKLKMEQERLASEKAAAEARQRLLKEQQLLAEQQKKLAQERSRLQNDQMLLAAIPKNVVRPKIKLRSKGKAGLSKMEIKRDVRRLNIYHPDWNPTGGTAHEIKDNGDGTVTDQITGLVWHKDGPVKLIDLNSRKKYDARVYVRKLNESSIGGYDDWRLPTLQELQSLAETEKSDTGLHLNPVFGSEAVWLSDDTFPNRFGSGQHLYFINFSDGTYIGGIGTITDIGRYKKIAFRAVRSDLDD